MRNKFINLFIKKDPVTQSEEIKIGSLFIAIILLWLISGIALFFYDDRGTFGDMFGSINTLFSGLAFGGIIYTIYQQRAEFKLQRIEFGEQVEILKIQRFETSFFNMITLHNEIIRAMYLEFYKEEFLSDGSRGIKKNTFHGREIFDELRKSYHQQYEDEKMKYQKENEYNLFNNYAVMTVLENASDSFFYKYDKQLGHYLRNIIALIELIDELTDSSEIKKYIRILKAQLSSYEYVLLFYSCFAKEYKDLKDNIKKYNLLDNLNEDLLLKPNAFKKAYNHLND